MTGSQIYSAAWRAILVLLTVEIVAVSALRYFTGSEAPPPPILANPFADPFLVLHVAGGATALLVAPVQFVRRVRTRWPNFHRAAGRIYVAACALAAPTGFVLALGSFAGPVAGAGFAVQAVLWAAFTGLAWRSAVERRFADHREWMLRSYACTSSAITFRLMLPAAGYLGLDFLATYRVIAWLPWIVNLAIFEYYIRRTRTSTSTRLRLASA